MITDWADTVTPSTVTGPTPTTPTTWVIYGVITIAVALISRPAYRAYRRRRPAPPRDPMVALRKDFADLQAQFTRTAQLWQQAADEREVRLRADFQLRERTYQVEIDWHNKVHDVHEREYWEIQRGIADRTIPPMPARLTMPPFPGAAT